MTETKNTSMVLSANLAEVYSQVDGLSLQNLFYVKNNAFPNCYMFTRSSRGSDNYFDTPKMLEHLKETIPADENMMYIVYSCYDLDTKEEKLGFSIILQKSNIFARMEIEMYLSESHAITSLLIKFFQFLPLYMLRGYRFL
jgi:hypothetical protein